MPALSQSDTDSAGTSTKEELDTLEYCTSRLGESYTKWKDGEKKKETERKTFFELADEALIEGDVPQTQVTTVYGPTREDAEARVALHHADSDLIDLEPKGEGWWIASIKQKPEFLPYSFANKRDGQFYSRRITPGSTHLDNELLIELDLDLYLRTTEYQGEPMFRELLGDHTEEAYEAIEFYCEQHDIPRVLKPFERISPEDLAKLQPYMYIGKPKVALNAPRKAKPEDFEDAE